MSQNDLCDVISLSKDIIMKKFALLLTFCLTGCSADALNYGINENYQVYFTKNEQCETIIAYGSAKTADFRKRVNERRCAEKEGHK